MKDFLEKTVKKAVSECGFGESEILLECPENRDFGDYSTNVGLALAKTAKEKPQVVAERIKNKILENKSAEVEKIEVAGPGFINFYLSRKVFSDEIEKIISQGDDYGKSNRLKGKKVMIEYTDPNPFKEFHIGHLMSNAIGESISRLVEFSGADVRRACYQGDVGLHTAKAIWGMKSSPAREGSPLDSLDLFGKVRYLGHSYKLGAAAYNDPKHKNEIEEINEKIYNRSDSEINRLYDWGRKTSLDYFEIIYKRLGTKFDFYFFESEMAEPGANVVKEFLEKGIFEKSDGAVVFRGEKYNPKLHTRVFITSKGLPTYEAKELGLHFTKAKEFDADLSIVITANEQDAVFSVGLEALKQIDSDLASRVKHISHGMLRLPSGKMSSRTGDVITADSLLSEITKLVSEVIKARDYSDTLKSEIEEKVSVGALKYSILKQNIGGDIIFDFEKSISFTGDSGPYLEYSATRANSVLLKALNEKLEKSFKVQTEKANALEKTLVKFPEIVSRSASEYSPHYLVTYLTELSSAFNNFYANEQIVAKDDKYSPYKIALTEAFVQVMKNGLWILGIPIPSKM